MGLTTTPNPCRPVANNQDFKNWVFFWTPVFTGAANLLKFDQYANNTIGYKI
jgi:hypothetical protein